MGALCGGLGTCGLRTPCLADDRRAGGVGADLIVIIEQNGLEHLAHMPFHIIGKHAQEHMRAHAMGTAMMNRAHLYVDALETAEGALGVGELLVSLDG